MGYKRSVFPEGGIDTLVELFDLPPSQTANAQRFQELKTNSNKTTFQTNEYNALVTTLQSYIIDVEKWNKFCDICINLETFFKNNVQGYIATKQTEFDATITTKSNQFNAVLQQFTDKGLFSSSIPYQRMNTVVYNSQTYISLQDSNLNHTPIEGSTNTYWQIMALRGKQGVQGIGISMGGVYNNATPYSPNQGVTYNGSVYYSLQDTIGNLPSTSSAYWGVFQLGVTPIIQSTQPQNISSGQIWIQTF